MTCFSNPIVPDVIISNVGKYLIVINTLLTEICYYNVEIQLNNRIDVINETKQVFFIFNETDFMKSFQINVTAYYDIVCMIDEYPQVEQCQDKILASSKFSYKYSPIAVSNFTAKNDQSNDLKSILTPKFSLYIYLFIFQFNDDL